MVAGHGSTVRPTEHVRKSRHLPSLRILFEHVQITEVLAYSAWWGLLRGVGHGAGTGAATLLIGAAVAGVLEAGRGHPSAQAASWLPLALLYLPHAAAVGARVGAGLGSVLGVEIGVLGARWAGPLGRPAGMAGAFVVVVAAAGFLVKEGPQWGAGILIYLPLFWWSARRHGLDVGRFAANERSAGSLHDHGARTTAPAG